MLDDEGDLLQRNALQQGAQGRIAGTFAGFRTKAFLTRFSIPFVVATALSYGLSQYALEVLVRTLILELIPLYAALFVAVRYTMPEAQRMRGLLADELRRGVGALTDVAPAMVRLLAGAGE